jgi:RHS repeat-associated protein
MESTATRILAMTTFDETGTYVENLFYTHDLLKNTTGLFDAQGECRALYEYGPYGNVVRMEGDMAEDNPFRFSSEYSDDELGLVYYNYRYYNTSNGRWINRDVIREKGGKNLYSFIRNKISIKTDYLGLLYYAPMICAISEMHDDGKNCSWTCQCPPNYRHSQYGNTPTEYKKPCCWTGIQAMCFCDPNKGNCRAPNGVMVYDNEGVPVNSTVKDSEVESPSPIEPKIEPEPETNPWVIAAGVGIIIGTILEDVYSGGVGISDDPATLSLGWGLILGGL